MHPNNTRILRVTLILLAAAVLWQVPLYTAAAPAELPPRPTAEPTATQVAEPAQDDTRAGATIALRASGMPAAVWTVVQWQDAHGDWHDVEGWQGTLEVGVKRWWVAPADFRRGPFRWALYASRGGDLLATSDTFDLPQSPYEIVTITIEPASAD